MGFHRGHRGQRVVCVDDAGGWKFEYGGRVWNINRECCPRKGGYYTVDGHNSSGYVIFAELQAKRVYVEEAELGFAEGPEPWGWLPERFRAVEEKSTEAGMEVLLAIARNHSVKLGEDA